MGHAFLATHYYKDSDHVVNSWPNGKQTTLETIKLLGAFSQVDFDKCVGTQRNEISCYKANMMWHMGCGTEDAGTCERCLEYGLRCIFSTDEKE